MAERGAEGRTPTLEEIKSDLQARCAGIPFAAWHRFFPSLQIPIGSHMESPLLPSGVRFGSHEVDGNGIPLPVRHTVGHDSVETFLARNGQILEKLVHYSSDGPDSETRLPDEVLGETSEKRYSWAYPIVVGKLDRLKEKVNEAIK